MKKFLILVLTMVMLGAAATGAGAAPPAGEDVQGFIFVNTSVALEFIYYDTAVGYSYGGGFCLSDDLEIHVEGAPASLAVGACYTVGDNLAVNVEYQYVAGWVYTPYGWEYVEISGGLAGVYYRAVGPGLWRGPYSDRNVSLFGAGLAVATDGYDTVVGYFLEFKSTEYIAEHVALTSGLTFSGGLMVSSLGMMIEF